MKAEAVRASADLVMMCPPVELAFAVRHLPAAGRHLGIGLPDVNHRIVSGAFCRIHLIFIRK
jgi:hypothetical protein